MPLSFFLAVVLRSRFCVLSYYSFLTGNTSLLSFNSLQLERRKSLKVNLAQPIENLASFSSSGDTYSSQSCNSTFTNCVAKSSLNKTGSCQPTKKTCLCINLTKGYYGNSSEVKDLPSMKRITEYIGLYFDSVLYGISFIPAKITCSGLSFFLKKSESIGVQH